MKSRPLLDTTGLAIHNRGLDDLGLVAGIAQLVERNLAKVEVAGSNPVSRSNIKYLRAILYVFSNVYLSLKTFIPVCLPLALYSVSQFL